MPKDEDQKIQEAVVRAEFAQQAAMNALTTTQVIGTILNSVLAMLQAKAILTRPDLERIFFESAASIDVMEPSNNSERTAQEQMRAIIVHVAKSFHIEIPPPGQTGMARKQ
jgi:hypothetical protein